MLDLLGRMGWDDRTITHGIRAAFKTWATERTNYPREVVELCLSYVQGDPLERAYQRGGHPREALSVFLRAWRTTSRRQRGGAWRIAGVQNLREPRTTLPPLSARPIACAASHL